MDFLPFDYQKYKTIGLTAYLNKNVSIEELDKNLQPYTDLLYIKPYGNKQYFIDNKPDTFIVPEPNVDLETDFNDSNSFLKVYVGDHKLHIFWNHAVADGITIFDILYKMLNIKVVNNSSIPMHNYKWTWMRNPCHLIPLFLSYKKENLVFNHLNINIKNKISKTDIRETMEKYTLDMNTSTIIKTISYLFDHLPFSIQKINMMINVAIDKIEGQFNNFSCVPLIVNRTDDTITIVRNIEYNTRYCYLLYKMMCRNKVKKHKSSFFVDVVYSSGPDNRHSYSDINFIEVHQRECSYPIMVMNRFSKTDAQQSILVNTDMFL